VEYGPGGSGNAGLTTPTGNDAGRKTKAPSVVVGRGPLSKTQDTPWIRDRRRLTRFPASSNVAVARAGAGTDGGHTLASACVILRRSPGEPQFFQGIGTAVAGVDNAAATDKHAANDAERLLMRRVG
jgi:hypothetical protein